MLNLNVSTPLLMDMYESMVLVLQGVPVEKTKMEYCVGIMGELIEEVEDSNREAEAEEEKTKNLLDELYEMVLIEEDRELSSSENARYVDIVEYLKLNNVEIPFGISL